MPGVLRAGLVGVRISMVSLRVLVRVMVLAPVLGVAVVVRVVVWSRILHHPVVRAGLRRVRAELPSRLVPAGLFRVVRALLSGRLVVLVHLPSLAIFLEHQALVRPLAAVFGALWHLLLAATATPAGLHGGVCLTRGLGCLCQAPPSSLGCLPRVARPAPITWRVARSVSRRAVSIRVPATAHPDVAARRLLVVLPPRRVVGTAGLGPSLGSWKLPVVVFSRGSL